jgi:hypothetical protein
MEAVGAPEQSVYSYAQSQRGLNLDHVVFWIMTRVVWLWVMTFWWNIQLDLKMDEIYS